MAKKMQFTYRDEQDRKDKKKYEELSKLMPGYVDDFLASKSKLLFSTKVSYANDLLTFFKFLEVRLATFSINNDSNNIDNESICKKIEEKLKTRTLTLPMGEKVEEMYLPMKDIDIELFNALTETDITKYLVHLQLYNSSVSVEQKNTSRSQAHKFTVLCGLCRYLKNKKRIDEDITLMVESPGRKEKKAVIYLNQEEVKKYQKAVKNLEVGTLSNTEKRKYNAADVRKKKLENYKYRDYAIITLLLNTGIRVSELVGIDIKHIDFTESCIALKRKGALNDKVYINESVCEALNSYINYERKNYIPKAPDGEEIKEPALFLSSQKRRIATKSVERIVTKFANGNVTDKRITPHKLRSTYATALYNETRDINIVGTALNHGDLSSTLLYVNVEEEKKKDAAQLDIYKQSNNKLNTKEIREFQNEILLDLVYSNTVLDDETQLKVLASIEKTLEKYDFKRKEENNLSKLAD